MNLLVIVGAVLMLAAVAVNVMAIVMGFKVSVKQGIVALLAPALLGGGLTVGYIVAHDAAMAEVGAKEVRAQGDKETQKQIDELKEVENIDLGL
ncbi:MAG: hypothetical protein JXX29_14140 [Deltaproteobacteria bacterium]|nr:hypothetical protein [Deltaproteobacteria bacterium]MBN2672818.1 hypothetical protein [Deltaproteobacteria bacterium]